MVVAERKAEPLAGRLEDRESGEVRDRRRVTGEKGVLADLLLEHAQYLVDTTVDPIRGIGRWCRLLAEESTGPVPQPKLAAADEIGRETLE